MEVFLGIGELHAATRPSRVRTVLGSCIAVTMHHPGRAAGAICHASLPTAPRGRVFEMRYRYVDQVIPAMLSWFARQGLARRALIVKLFGGGDMYGLRSAAAEQVSVGRQNVGMALSVLQREELPLTASDVGGRHGRLLLFDTDTGQVWVEKTSPLDSPSFSPPDPRSAF